MTETLANLDISSSLIFEMIRISDLLKLKPVLLEDLEKTSCFLFGNPSKFLLCVSCINIEGIYASKGSILCIF